MGNNIFVLRFHSPQFADQILPGQFIHIKVSAGYVPLLRRPFSVYRVEEDFIEIIFNAVGRGTTILSKKKTGDYIDVLGPLGTSYGVYDEFNTALLVAGGLGVAPLPMITSSLVESQKLIITFIGARTWDQLVTDHLREILIATDDGSKGFRGTVVDLLAMELRCRTFARPKIFACGPNIMLKNLALLAASHGIPCEVSLECTMACGFGICQGCPVERVRNGQASSGDQRKYSLVCKEGPVFDTQEVIIE